MVVVLCVAVLFVAILAGILLLSLRECGKSYEKTPLASLLKGSLRDYEVKC